MMADMPTRILPSSLDSGSTGPSPVIHRRAKVFEMKLGMNAENIVGAETRVGKTTNTKL